MIRTVSRSAVGGYISLVRFPFDSGVRLFGNGRWGSRAELALDRFDAAARQFAGRALRDEELVEDGARLRVATSERERALSLREEAEARSQHADGRIADREKHAERQRREAAKRSADRKKRAERQRKAESRRLSDVEARRKAAARKAATDRKASLNHRAKKGRLEQLDQEAGALAKRERALVAKQESQRLRQAASKTKAARKRG
jgi:colicin import membrane protein